MVSTQQRISVTHIEEASVQNPNGHLTNADTCPMRTLNLSLLLFTMLSNGCLSASNLIVECGQE